MALDNRILILAFILIIDLSLSVQQCPSPLGYDTTNLTLANRWQFDLPGECINDNTNSTCHFYLTFCKSLPNSGDCTGSSICQYSNNQDDIFELGHYDNDDPFIAKEVNGFYAKFNRVKPIINKFTNQPCNLSVNIEFDCDKNVPWAVQDDISQAPLPLNYTGYTKDSCEIQMKFAYAGACHKIVTVTTTTTETPYTPSKLCIPPDNGYNISSLTYAAYWVFDVKDGCQTFEGSNNKCQLYMSFCKPIENVLGCSGSSACIRYPNNTLHSHLVIGNFTVDPFTSKEDNGFFANFVSGETILNPYMKKECVLSVQMEFVCDLLDIWDLPDDVIQPGKGPVPNYQTITENSCEIKVVVPYSGACLTKPVKPTGLSTGSILLIFFLVVFVAYLFIGMGYNKFVDNQTGAKIIPNYTFWTGLLLLVLEGIVFSWRFITCQKQQKTSYQTIEG